METNSIQVPHSVLAAGWIPFVVVSVLIAIFSFIYVRLYQHKYDKELCSTLASVMGLALALFTFALLPVDIFLVSFMKHSNGTFKDWAADNNTRIAIENGVLYTYYALYSLVMLFLFVVIPMAYFFYEEGDETSTMRERCCSALKYSLVFIFFGVILFLIGIFVPFQGAGFKNSTATEWEIFEETFKNVNKTAAEKALSFLIGCLALIGMIIVVIYTGIGMASWPLNLIKGRRSLIKEHRDLVEERITNRSRIEDIRNRYGDNRPMSRRDRDRLNSLEDQQQLIERREQQVELVENSCFRKCSIAMRPFQIIFGVLFILVALLIFISLLLTNIDRLINSNGKIGYSLVKSSLPNLLDIILVFAQKIFPLDYILMFGLLIFLILSSMGGICTIGIRFFCIKMFRVVPHKTKPQGLLLMSYSLMFIVVALNVLVHQLTPQYLFYGSQHYLSPTNTIKPCTLGVDSDQCVMTSMGQLLLRFFLKLWYFGAAYYWMTWGFLLMFILSFVITVIKKRQSMVEEVTEEELIESDDEMIR